MTERPVAIVYGRFFLIYENFLSLRFLQQLQRTLNQSQYPLFFLGNRYSQALRAR